MDVKSLTIPHDMGLRVVANHLRELCQTAYNYNEFVLELLKFILMRNVFMFSLSHYLQVQGVMLLPIVCQPEPGGGGVGEEPFCKRRH